MSSRKRRGCGPRARRAALLLALSAAGAACAAPSWFRVHRRLDGVPFRHLSGDDAQLTVLEQNGQGLCLLDYDGDGWSDLFVANGSTEDLHRSGRDPGPRLYRNLGNWRFEDRTGEAGIEISAWTTGCAAGDLDGDGDADLFVTAWGPNRLLLNGGDGRFADVTAEAGIAGEAWSSSAAMADFDRDGRLDLYVSNYVHFDFETVPRTEADGSPCLYRGVETGCGPWRWNGQPDTLYLQDGRGGFVDATAAWGVRRATDGFRGMGVVAADFDEDGWIDVYVGCDVMKNLHLRNRGGAGFESIGDWSGGSVNAEGRHESGMGVAAADFDGDGDLDLFTTNFAAETNTYYENLGGQQLGDRTAAVGLDRHPEELAWAVTAADFDGDGHLDLFVANGQIYPQVAELEDPLDTYRQAPRLFRGGPGLRLVEVPTAAAFGEEIRVSLRGAAVGDLDHDGDLDLLAVDHRRGVVAFENRSAAPGLLVDLRSAGPGRSALHSELRLETGGRRLYRTLLPHQGYQSSHEWRLHFALEPGERPRRLEIRPPEGPVRALLGLEDLHQTSAPLTLVIP